MTTFVTRNCHGNSHGHTAYTTPKNIRIQGAVAHLGVVCIYLLYLKNFEK